MIPATSSWLLTVLFLVIGGWSLIDAALTHSDGAVGRISCLWHALMCLGMIAMIWGPTTTISAVIWSVVFLVGAARFGRLAMGRRRSGRRDVAVTMCHALLSVSMVVMVWTMQWMPDGLVGGAQGAVPGPDGAGSHRHATSTGLGGTATPGWFALWCLANVVLLVGVGAFLAVGRIEQARHVAGRPIAAAANGQPASPPRPPLTAARARWSPRLALATAADVGMAAGMALAFLQMA